MPEKKEKPENPDKLPMGRFFAWKTRDISLACNTIILGYLTIYCTDTLQMPAALVGTVLMATKIFDGITDLFAGYIVDNTKTRLGKARPYELCIIGTWASTLLLFSVPDIGLSGKVIWVFCAYSFTISICNTILGANQTPFLIRAFGSRQVVVKVGSFGGIVSTLGAAVVAISFPMVMRYMLAGGASWTRLVGIYAIPLLLIGILRFIFVKETYNLETRASGDHVTFKEIFAVFKSNRYVWVMAGFMGLFNVVLGINAVTYYFTWIVGDIGKYGTLQAFTIIMLASMFFFPKLIKRFSVVTMLSLGAVIGVAGYGLNFFAGSNMILLGAGLILFGFANLPFAYLGGVLYMDCAAYNEWKGNRRLEGTMGAVVGFTVKLGGGVGTAMLGLLLGAAGYNGALEVQPSSAIWMIRLLYSLIPALIYALMFIVIRFYTLEKLRPRIEKENAERRDQAAAAAGTVSEKMNNGGQQ